MTTEQNPLDAVYTEGAVTDAAELYDNMGIEPIGLRSALGRPQ